MNRKAVSGVMLTLLLISMLTLSFNIQLVKAEPGTWTVDDDGPADFSLIQEAINVASDGDTIFVKVGTYYENVVVYKKVSLIGENRDTTIIDGSGTGVIIGVTADDTTISGFTVRNGNEGIYVARTHNNIIIHNYITNIILYNGIHLVESNGNTINYNTISNCHDCGILLLPSSINNMIAHNYIIISDSILPGVALVDHSNYNTITNNTISNWGGVGIYLGRHITTPGFCSHNSISDNTVTSNSRGGIHLTDHSNYNSITNNTVSSNFAPGYDDYAPGIALLDHCDYNNIENNTVSNSRDLGVYLGAYEDGPGFCSYNIISGNTVTSNNMFGIALLDHATYNTITNNTVSTNLNGIYLGGYSTTEQSWPGFCSDNTISNNTITNNDIGIELWDSSGGNLVYHNDFTSNTCQVASDSINVWDDGYPSGGNYWSDCTDVDLYSGPYQNEAGSDGIWDHPYVIDADNQDRYPLVNPWTPTPPSEWWTFAIITDLHIGRGYPDYGGEGVGLIEDQEVAGQDYYLTERLNDTVEWVNGYKSEYNISFVTVLGDISDSGEYSELKKAKDILDRLDVPYIPVIGNHDIWPYTQDEEFEYVRYFEYVFKDQLEKLERDPSFNLRKQPNPEPKDLQNYAFSYNGVKFIILDCVAREPAFGIGPGVGADAVLWDNTLNWLTENLHANARAREPTIILSHHPLIWSEAAAFSMIEITTIDEAIRISDADVLAGFAGHIHGFYDEYRGFHPDSPLPIKNPIFMDANKVYDEVGDMPPANIPVVTTEAVMVASNEPKPKGVIRIVKMRGNEIPPDYSLVEAEFRALNPYLKEKIHVPFGMEFLGPFGSLLRQGAKIHVDFEAYAFTKRFREEDHLEYVLDLGWPWREIIESYEEERVTFRDYYLEPGGTYDVNLIVRAGPEGERIVEEIKKEITLPQPLIAVACSPVDIVLTDPEGFIISKQLNEISEATYSEIDVNGDSHLDDIIYILDRKIGDYIITVIPEPDASPTDTYSLEVWAERTAIVLADDMPISDIPSQPYRVRSTDMETIPVFVWNYVFTDSDGRGTTLKINTEHEFFQFVTPDNDYGIKKATHMQVHRTTVNIRHEDSELRLITLALNTELDFCIAVAWDMQTSKQYLLIDKPGIE